MTIPGQGQTFTHNNQRWEVSRLISLAAGLPIQERDIRSFAEWNWWVWEPVLNLSAFVEHMKRVLQADLTQPIILSAEGWIMDGCHRLAKARLNGIKTIKAVQFPTTPEPDVPDMEGAVWADMQQMDRERTSL